MNVLPIHITGMENIKGQQSINAILDSINYEIDNHKWTVTTQEYTNLRFEKYLESGATLTVDQKPKSNIPVVGTHNGRKVYIGDLDVQGNLNIGNLALRDNVSTTTRTWENRGSSVGDGSLQGDTWTSWTFNVGIREPKILQEVTSIPNDIKDTTYGDTIYNKETTTAIGTSLDTKTFEKTENSYYIAYPTIVTTVTDNNGNTTETREFVLDKWKNEGFISYSVGVFPKITKSTASLCWAIGQYYGKFKWVANSGIQLLSYQTYSSYDEFYNAVSDDTDTSDTGIMIPSWQFIKSRYSLDCSSYYVPISTRRFISEEFDKRNSGIVKVDIAYRI